MNEHRARHRFFTPSLGGVAWGAVCPAGRKGAAVDAGFVPARLGDLTLRIETAAAALLVGVNAFLAD